MNKEIISYDDIERIGTELFIKNNESFVNSKFSKNMSKIFLAANKDSGITEIKDEYYMKSSKIPNKKILYIYSEQLRHLKKYKIYDIVNFNDNECIWIYSLNTIDMIGLNPVTYTIKLFTILTGVLRPLKWKDSFARIEDEMAIYALSIRLVYFIYKLYGVIDIDEYEKDFINLSPLSLRYTKESIKLFFDNVIDGYNYQQYFFERGHLDAYMLLEEIKNDRSGEVQ